MKRGFKIVLIGMSVLTLVACSKQEASNKQEESGKQQESNSLETSAALPSAFIVRHPRPVDFCSEYPEYFATKRAQLPDHNTFGYDLRSSDLSDANLTNEYDKLLEATYDSKTTWPASLPDGFDPAEIMELYKNPGLNVRSLHEDGVTGKGVGIAIIDQPLLVEHCEYKDQLRYYNEHRVTEGDSASMHGCAVASIAVGKSVGVAPDANLYFIGDPWQNNENTNGYAADDINELLDLNKTLPKENRIRVISLSWGWDADLTAGHEKIEAAFARAKSEGVLMLTTSIYERENVSFFGLEKIPLSDPDDYNTYTENKYGNDVVKYRISVPMSFRTTASPTGANDYTAYSVGGLSWATPYVAGLYVLACQVYPDITCDEFWKVASETSHASTGVYNDKNYRADYIVDPVALIEEVKKMAE